MKVALVISLTIAASADAEPTPRSRAAYGMVLNLRDYARKLGEMDPRFAKTKCPSDIMWVTWGMAKSDPWGSPFLLRCTPTIEIGSPGPDRKEGTADDLWSDKPLVDAATGCKSACKKAKACRRGIDKWCGDACKLPSSDAAFYADTCAALDSCDAALDCLDSAARGRAGFASCEEFGKAAARAVGRPKTVAALTAECERDVLRAPELVCVASSATAAELVRCFLTVNRDHVERILTE